MNTPRVAAGIVAVAAVALGVSGAVAAAVPPTPITVHVDARRCDERVLHVREVLPAKPGVLAISYPNWIPGFHGPVGQIVDVAGIRTSVNGALVEWRRDDLDLHTLRVTVPPGGHDVTLDFDVLLGSDEGGEDQARCSSAQLLMLDWCLTVFAPKGAPAATIPFRASLTLPEGWDHASALPELRGESRALEFATVSLEELVDSPVLAGRYFRHIPLDPGGFTTLEVACDSRAGLAFGDAVIEAHARLTREAFAMFGGAHQRRYRFLVALSDHIAPYALEHHESSDNRMPERAWVDDGERLEQSALLPHEYAHSWNGKYRRPAGLATADYGAPMRDEMLWVYEGLTQYLGWVLTARSGLCDSSQASHLLAWIASTQAATTGRAWRPLVDTAIEADALYRSMAAGSHWRRGTDFYDEGALVWLEVDATIRRLTNGARSLDDFLRAFHGGNGAPVVKPYTLDDVVTGLNAVAPNAWAEFLRTRVYRVRPEAPYAGLEAAGWKVVFRDSITDVIEAHEKSGKSIDLLYSLGLQLTEAGVIADVVSGTPAGRAGVPATGKLLAVNGRRWNTDVLLDAVRATAQGEPITLLVENADYLRSYALDYDGGARYPVLERIAGTPDRLADIFAPRTAH